MINYELEHQETSIAWYPFFTSELTAWLVVIEDIQENKENDKAIAIHSLKARNI
jgi:hypothetical protein